VYLLWWARREASAAILSTMSLTTEFTMHMDSVVDADPDPDFDLIRIRILIFI
jgi:hypothetical protein